MQKTEFKDYYDILQVSPSADQDTIDSIFRHLARRYHPDNQITGDSDKFRLVVEAHDTLKDPSQRAGYDVLHTECTAGLSALHQELTGDSGIATDLKIQTAMVRMLYHRCRDHFRDPGMGLYQIGQLLNCTSQRLEFHVWYLKEKGWIRRLEDGSLGITVEGVDRAIAEELQNEPHKRITYQPENAA